MDDGPESGTEVAADMEIVCDDNILPVTDERSWFV
jgi:hypothetical protein